MNTKRVNDEFHRLDVKLPIELYEQISTIAVNSFSARVHHISGKPEITPTLIYLLELGVQSFTSGNELIKKYDTDKYTDTIPITERGVKTLIKDELIPIQSKLDELSEIVYRLTNTDTNTDSLSIAVTDRILDNLTDNNTDKLTDKIDHSESLNLPSKEDEGVIIPETEDKGNLIDIPSLVAKYGFSEGAIEDKEKLALLVGEVLKRKVTVNDLSRIPKNEKSFTAPDIFWQYFRAEQINRKWKWTLITTA